MKSLCKFLSESLINKKIASSDSLPVEISISNKYKGDLDKESIIRLFNVLDSKQIKVIDKISICKNPIKISNYEQFYLKFLFTKKMRLITAKKLVASIITDHIKNFDDIFIKSYNTVSRNDIWRTFYYNTPDDSLNTNTVDWIGIVFRNNTKKIEPIIEALVSKKVESDSTKYTTCSELEKFGFTKEFLKDLIESSSKYKKYISELNCYIQNDRPKLEFVFNESLYDELIETDERHRDIEDILCSIANFYVLKIDNGAMLFRKPIGVENRLSYIIDTIRMKVTNTKVKLV